MSVWRQLHRGEGRIDFVGNRRRWLQASLGLVAISIVSLTFRQLNLGLEFRGGVALQSPNPNAVEVAEVRSVVTPITGSEVRIQLVGDGQSIRLQSGSLTPDEQNRLVEAVATVTGAEQTQVSVTAVGPTFGSLILQRSLVALGVFLVAVVLFMSWRLELKMALTGLVALVHDLVLTAGVYSITGFEVTPATVVAILTILGYSLYDTVVVFDKVEELVTARREEATYSDIVNRAMNQVFIRSLNTSLSTLLIVGSILVVGAFILGAGALRDFALALFVGIAAGTYSSIFVAAPLLAGWKEGEDEWQRRRRRLAGKDAASTARSGGRTVQPARRGGSVRPPKKRRR